MNKDKFIAEKLGVTIKDCGECPYIYFYVNRPGTCCKKYLKINTSAEGVPHDCPMLGKSIEWPKGGAE